MQSDADPQQSRSGMQFSSTDLACLIRPLQKKTRLEDDEVHSDEDAENNDVSQGLLVLFQRKLLCSWKLLFSIKLDNNARKVKANCKAKGTP